MILGRTAFVGGNTLSLARRAALAAVLACATVRTGLASGTWTRVVRNPPASIYMMLLLPDGTVMAANNNGTSAIGNAWYRLTPDAHGSYINGTWTTPAPMHDTRLYYSSQVLRDGRVFVAGGEYGTGGPRAEVYDPQTNVWTQVNPPVSLLNPAQVSPVTHGVQSFVDSVSQLLPSGNVLVAPVSPMVSGEPLIYNPMTNTWAAGPLYVRGGYQDEASWVKLADDSILTIDPFGQNSERYIPAANTWVNDGAVPNALYDPFGLELGGAFLLPDGRAFFLGSTGQTALYTPTGTSGPGAWAAGPVIPGGHGTPDAPAAMMVNGKILCAVSPAPTGSNHYPSPTTFYEYDSATNTFASTGAPVGSSDPIAAYEAIMLALPDGGVLYSHFNTSVYEYQPAGAVLASGKPTIASVTPNGDGSYHLTGTGLNGISQGAAYGDDNQMASNYPLVRATDGAGNVTYARTFNWSSTGVMTGSQVVSTEYRWPAGPPAGPYSIVVVANGNPSDPTAAASISADPVSQTACPGGSAVFTVTASGTDQLTYLWQRGTTPLANGGNISGADTATLTVSSVGPADAGSDYNCVVSNVFGAAASGMVSLNYCYANCDCSVSAPMLTVSDFGCFLNKFAAGDPSANCDQSTSPPVLNVADFSCFLNAFAAGCP